MTDQMREFIKLFLSTPFTKEYVAKVFVSEMDPTTLYFTAVKPFLARMAKNATPHNFDDFVVCEVGLAAASDDEWTIRVINSLQEVTPDE